jgi:hypothetical protein
VTDVPVLSIIVPSAIFWRNDGHQTRCDAPQLESSLARGVTNAVVHHCNMAWIRRVNTESLTFGCLVLPLTGRV